MKIWQPDWRKNDWIFSIDSDEVADEALIEAIRAAVLENEKEHIFSLSRLNHYHGRLIKGCGWYPDIIPRLYHRRFTRFFRPSGMSLWCCRRKPRLNNSMAV